MPRNVPWSEVVERDAFDDRMEEVDVACGPIIDVTTEGVALPQPRHKLLRVRPIREELDPS